jgi:hypothetical protein
MRLPILDAMRLTEDVRDVGHAIRLLQGIDEGTVGSKHRLWRLIRGLKEMQRHGQARIRKEVLK